MGVDCTCILKYFKYHSVILSLENRLRYLTDLCDSVLPFNDP